jgi:hypothetical protein
MATLHWKVYALPMCAKFQAMSAGHTVLEWLSEFWTSKPGICDLMELGVEILGNEAVISNRLRLLSIAWLFPVSPQVTGGAPLLSVPCHTFSDDFPAALLDHTASLRSQPTNIETVKRQIHQ